MLKKSPLILNAEGNMMAAHHGKHRTLYLNSSSQYKRVAAGVIVNTSIAKEFKLLLQDGFGISIAKLQQFGLYSSLLKEGEREDSRGGGYPSWKALGEYCPGIEIEGLSENIKYIEKNQGEELAKEKSAEMLKFLLKISSKLAGNVQCRKSNPYMAAEKSRLLSDSIIKGDWLFDENGGLCSTTGISKYDLNTEIYGKVIDNKEVYTILGFVETEADARAEAFDMVYSIWRKEIRPFCLSN